jgi:hypothetical protein
MWGEVVALHARYPQALAAVKDQWWTDPAQTEILCALASWRRELDDSGHDPREELAFHHQLNDYHHTIRQQSGSLTNAWKPGAPPKDWAAS